MGTRPLLIAGVITFATGLLIPLSGRILDVFLIFSLSLTVAALIITFSARRAVEVLGFPLLIVLAAMLRMALSLAGSRLILSQGDAGTIIGFFGGIFVRESFVLAVLGFGVLTVFIFGTISRAVRNISRTAEDFVVDIVPARQISVDRNLSAGLIDRNQAVELHNRIARETGFFAAMAGATKFLLCAAVVELVIVLVDIVGSMVTSPAAGQMSAGYLLYEGLQNGDLRIHATLGAGMITQISALLAVAACRYLVAKTYLPCAGDSEFVAEESAERVKVVPSEVLWPKTAESHYGGTIVAAQAETVAQDAQWLEESQCTEDERDDLAGETPSPAENFVQALLTGETEPVFKPELYLWKTADDDDYYNAITDLIESDSGDGAKTILMAAESTEALPVTVPVNIAMRLARKGQRCLLVDFDLQRDAVASVFDIDYGDANDSAKREILATGSPTCIKNLWVWSVSRIIKADEDSDNRNLINIKQALAGLKKQYDRVFVYAPAIGRLDDLQNVAACSKAAILFGGEPELSDAAGDSSLSDFYKLLTDCGCKVLQPVEVFAKPR
ncbi:MAG: FHIPEP family type III secretion protein [Planctomycetota bacterium]|nr:MAG: FHIPEP family type III secretion protein [Planctomycetota bacterium]